MPDDGAGGDAALSPVHPTGDALWDDWDTPPRVPSAPVLHLDGFDGPIDLLLDLVERQRLDLGRISIAALAEQFVAALARLARQVPIERRADWLVIASHLVLLRARLLFPATQAAAEAAERDAREEIARLDALRCARALAAWLQARPQLGQDFFTRPPRGPDPQIASYIALMEACLPVLREPDDQPATALVYRPAIPDLYRIPDALRRMRALLAAMKEPRPLEDFWPAVPAEKRDKRPFVRSMVASTLVAALELCRDGLVWLEQVEGLGGIMVSPRMTNTAEVGGRSV
jgi:segregation and condensation protein A